jgi:hypothetical protein
MSGTFTSHEQPPPSPKLDFASISKHAQPSPSRGSLVPSRPFLHCSMRCIDCKFDVLVLLIQLSVDIVRRPSMLSVSNQPLPMTITSPAHPFFVSIMDPCLSPHILLSTSRKTLY